MIGAICLVGYRADYDARDAALAADLGDCRPFHFTATGLEDAAYAVLVILGAHEAIARCHASSMGTYT